MHGPRRDGLVAALIIAAVLASCTNDDAPGQDASSAPEAASTGSGDATAGAPATTRRIELPGERVFPEGVAIDPGTDQLYVGSTEDGSVYRAGLDDDRAEVFLEPGADGRTAVTGLAVGDGILLVAGRDTGRIFAYETDSGELIEAFDTSGDGDRTLINDIAVAGDAAYVTDSFRPVLWRLDLSGQAIGQPEPWLDLAGSPIGYDDGFNLNGIASSADGTALLTVHNTTGELFRIDTATGEIIAVDLGGEVLTGGDGLELDGITLYAVAGDQLVTVDLDRELSSGTVTDRFSLDGSGYPTTLALTADDFVVVNSQLDMAGSDAEPTLPFTLSLIPRT